MGEHAAGESPIAGEALIPLLGARTAAYELLSRLFAEEPDAGFLESLAREGVIRDFPFSAFSPRIREGTALVSAHIDQPDNLRGEALERLRWDFTRMFVGPEKLGAPPWESVYLSGERLLFQPETLTVRQAYLKYDLLPEHFLHEADDHLALELEFMARLSSLAQTHAGGEPGTGEAGHAFATGDPAKETSAALDRVLNDQKAFLQQHLLKWVPAFAADVRRGAETDFYKGISVILDGFLELDHSILVELLRMVR